MSERFDFDDVEVFTTGAIGVPGQRTFYFQVRHDGRRVTVKCEKQQVAALAQYVAGLLADLPSPADRPLPQSMELTLPVEPAAFVVGPMGLAFDNDIDRFVLMIDEFVPADADDDDDDDDDDEDEIFDTDDVERSRLRLQLTRGPALALCEQADQVVAAGRPSCIWCGLPIDVDGHPCPRMN
jgi:uncharacterized repeat protein (TIGR03847 family)